MHFLSQHKILLNYLPTAPKLYFDQSEFISKGNCLKIDAITKLNGTGN